LTSQPEFVVCGEAVDGVAAIEKAKELRPDAVLMDVAMPRMDGLQATRAIRRQVPGAKVVIVSQNDPVLVRQQTADVGAHGFIAKGDLGDKLIPELERVLSNGRQDGPNTGPSESVAPPTWLIGGGEMGEHIRKKDRAKTSLGPLSSWPSSLRTAVTLMLNSQQAMWIGWGPQQLFLYNDAYVSVLSLAKHPWALGRPAREVWAEIWDSCGPLVEKVFGNGEASFIEELRLLMLGPLQDLLARSQSHLSPTAKEQLELVNRNGARLLRLVNALLDFSRIEAGRVQAVYLATDLARFTGDLASVFRSATDRAGLRLIVDCHEIGEPVYVDRDMWEKIVLNLVSNAFKFTFEGEISVTLEKIGETAELRVRDTGVGIPAEEMTKLFERFHRVPNTRSRTYEGSGIGLALNC
jgi:CheY-like chemotaxis protein